jgi:hypothetical protein
MARLSVAARRNRVSRRSLSSAAGEHARNHTEKLEQDQERSL